MAEIKLNYDRGVSAPERSSEDLSREEVIIKKKSGRSRPYRSLILLIIVIALLGGGWYYYTQKPEPIDPNESPYSAVFLTNGQVYFGMLEGKSRGEVKLSHVYYLNPGAETTDPTSPKYQLIKLGNEVHGPMDMMNINEDHVVFYEKLRKDSSVVQSINSIVEKN